MDTSFFKRGQLLVVAKDDAVFAFTDLSNVDTLKKVEPGSYVISKVGETRPSSVDFEIFLNGEHKHVIVSQQAIDDGYAFIVESAAWLSHDAATMMLERFIHHVLNH